MQIRDRVFLTSTFADLRDERAAVEACINRMALTYVGMEHFGSFAVEPMRECRRKVGEASLIVLVIASRYGSKPRGSKFSFTEFEYRTARSLEKPVLAYLKKIASDEVLEPPLGKFRDRVKRELGVSEYTDAADLAWQVASDIHRTGHHAQQSPVLKGGAIEQLRTLFALRAKSTILELQKYEGEVTVRTFLLRFRKLHKQHMGFLAAGDLLLAHETLNQIHQLSFDFERDAFWARDMALRRKHGNRVAYSLKPRAFMRGRMISRYAPEYENAGIDKLEEREMKRTLTPVSAAGLPVVESPVAMYRRLARIAKNA